MAKKGPSAEASPNILQGFEHFVTRNGALALALFAFLLYCPTVLNDWSFDDILVANTNYDLGLKGLWPTLTDYYIKQEGFNFEYRPVAQVTLILERALVGESPAFHHLMNAAYYALNIWLVFGLLIRLGLSSLFSFVITLLYVVHPVHTEVVASIKNREELLSFALSAASFRAWLRWARTDQRLMVAVGLFLFALAILTKKSCLPFIGIIPLGVFLTTREKGLAKAGTAFVLLAACTALIIMSVQQWLPNVVRDIMFVENPIVAESGLLTRLNFAMATLWFYVRIMFWPFPLCFYYGYNMMPVPHSADLTTFASIVLHMAVLVYSIRTLYRGEAIGFFGLAYLIGMLLYSNTVLVNTGIVTERALYAPSLFFISFVILIIGRLPILKRPQLIVPATILVLIPSVGWTVTRSLQWKNAVTLMDRDAPYVRRSAQANFNLGDVYWMKGEKSTDSLARVGYLKKAVISYERSLMVRENLFVPHLRIGQNAAFDLGDMEKGLHHLNRAIDIDPNSAEAHYLLGTAHLISGRSDQAEIEYAITLQLDSGHIEANQNLFLLLYRAGRKAEAEKINRSFMSNASGYFQSYENAGQLALEAGDTTRAEEMFKKALALNEGATWSMTEMRKIGH
jgi:hypothetical protein